MNLDENLDTNGEITETPTDSQSEIITTGQDDTVNQNGAETQTPEEANWNSLSGPSQERFKQMARNAALWRQQAEEAASRTNNIVPQAPVNNQTLAPDEQAAIRKLNETYGIATKTDVDRTVDEKVTERIAGLTYYMTLDKLESKFDGSNGLPAFSRDEYENYVATHPQYRNYTPEDVYEKMFPTEILESKIRSLGRTGTTTKQSPSLRSTRTQVREEQWTPEAIEARLQQADGPDWYDKNVNLVNTVLGRSAD